MAAVRVGCATERMAGGAEWIPEEHPPGEEGLGQCLKISGRRNAGGWRARTRPWRQACNGGEQSLSAALQRRGRVGTFGHQGTGPSEEGSRQGAALQQRGRGT